MELEEFRDIKGFENLYRISSYGTLMSNRSGKWRVLSNTNKKGGYLSVVLHDKDNKMYSTRIHRLVYENFVGKIPKGYTIHHIDFNRQNNRLSNLELLSVKEHAKKHREANPNIVNGMKMYNKFIKTNPIYQYSMEGVLLGIFNTAAEAGRKTGVCARNIAQVANKTEYKPGKTRKQAGGFIWKIKE